MTTHQEEKQFLERMVAYGSTDHGNHNHDKNDAALLEKGERYEKSDTESTFLLEDTETNNNDATHSLSTSKSKNQKQLDALINTAIIWVVIVYLLTHVALLIHDGLRYQGWTWHTVWVKAPIQIWHNYQAFLVVHPVLCKSLTSGIVYTVGDVFAQHHAEAVAWGDLDRYRTGRSAAAGLLLHGPVSHVWYNLCQTFFDDVLQWTAWWSVLFKVLADQLVFGPVWISLYITFLGVTQCKSMSMMAQEIQTCMPTLILSGLKLWPAAHVITYGVVPVENRLLWVDIVEIVWVVILSTRAAGHQVLEMDKDEQDETWEYLQDVDDTLILHSHVIPENVFGDVLLGEAEKPLQYNNIDEENVNMDQDRRHGSSTLMHHMRFSMPNPRRENLVSLVEQRRHNSHHSGQANDAVPMIFQGEEASIGLRAFTHGYDFYAPERGVCFHMYAINENKVKRQRVHKFWENGALYRKAAETSMKRLNSLIHVIDWPEGEWTQTEKDLYTLGKVRSVEKYFKTFGIHVKEQTVEHHLCRFVGKPMMKEFLPALRENRMGLDYDKINYEFVDKWKGDKHQF